MPKTHAKHGQHTHRDVFALIALPILSFILSLIFRTNLLISSFLFFGLPSVYLSLRNHRPILKTLIFSFLLSVPLTFILDYLLVKDKAWYIVGTVFPYRLFGVVAIEQFFFGFFWIYFLISLYEFMFDRHTTPPRDHLISKRLILFSLLAFAVAFTMVLLIKQNAAVVVIPYAYLVLGVFLGIIPISVFLIYYPRLFFRFLKVTLYFFILAILMEYVGLTLHQWVFPGTHYVFKVNLLGFSIPIEEIFYYFILSTPGILTYYEFLSDDQK